MIELENLVKQFGDLTAVNDLSLTVDKGEFFAVLGPNAAGKTTTIKMLVGLIKPNAGNVRVCGIDVQADPIAVRRHLAYVPDFPFLYDKLTPWEFLRFTGQLFHMNEDLIQERTRELIPRFNLDPYLQKRIESLSHGTRQRIAIVSALMHAPEVFVLDEPMVGLDPQGARVFVGPQDVDHVAPDPEAAAAEVELVALVLDRDQRADDVVTLPPLADLQGDLHSMVRLGRAEAATVFLEEALRLEPGEADFRIALAILAAQQGQWSEARFHAQQFSLEHPDDARGTALRRQLHRPEP